MPHGFFTIEQFKPKTRGGKPQWLPIAHGPKAFMRDKGKYPDKTTRKDAKGAE
jgi:hypothetical protein